MTTPTADPGGHEALIAEANTALSRNQWTSGWGIESLAERLCDALEQELANNARFWLAMEEREEQVRVAIEPQVRADALNSAAVFMEELRDSDEHFEHCSLTQAADNLRWLANGGGS